MIHCGGIAFSEIQMLTIPALETIKLNEAEVAHQQAIKEAIEQNQSLDSLLAPEG